VFVVACRVDAYRIADAMVTLQFFLEHFGVVVDQVIGHLEDAL